MMTLRLGNESLKRIAPFADQMPLLVNVKVRQQRTGSISTV
jgi:hypothetical protein